MIYVLIPAHNEAATVGVLLWKVRQVFTSFAREYQIVVVNDGSTDATAETLQPYARALPLTVLTNRRQLGYAACLDQLFRVALERSDRPRRDLAVTLQADFSDMPHDVPELIKRLESGADLVIAGRRLAGATGWARVAELLLPGALRWTLGIPGADSATGTLRAYRLGVIERLVRERERAPLLERQGRAADVELLVRAARYARRIEVVPVSGERLPAQRDSRADRLGNAWQAWRTALALRGGAKTDITLAPAPAPGAEAEPAPDITPESAADRPRRRGGRGRRRGGRGRGRRPDQQQPDSDTSSAQPPTGTA